MPPFDNFNNMVENIRLNFMQQNRIAKKELHNRHYKLFYHMHPNRRLKKMLFIYPFNVKNDLEANVPFFTISVNKINKNNKSKYLCIYNNLYEGGIKEIRLKFNENEDEKSIKNNIKELMKVIKIVKVAFNNLSKKIGKVDFYKQ